MINETEKLEYLLSRLKEWKRRCNDNASTINTNPANQALLSIGSQISNEADVLEDYLLKRKREQ